MEILQIAGTVETGSEIQVINNGEGPATKKIKARKVLGIKCGIGVMHSDSSSGSNSVTRLTPLEKANIELLMYLQYPQLEVEECPSNWWKKEYIHLPMLSSLAQIFLCICVTNVASECTFSTGGNIVTSKRNCLKSHVVDQLVFLAQNGPYSLLVRASYFISCSVHIRFSSVLSIDCKWRWGCRHF